MNSEVFVTITKCYFHKRKLLEQHKHYKIATTTILSMFHAFLSVFGNGTYCKHFFFTRNDKMRNFSHFVIVYFIVEIAANATKSQLRGNSAYRLKVEGKGEREREMRKMWKTKTDEFSENDRENEEENRNKNDLFEEFADSWRLRPYLYSLNHTMHNIQNKSSFLLYSLPSSVVESMCEMYSLQIVFLYFAHVRNLFVYVIVADIRSV